jgi:hypothetical protein
MKVMFCSLFLFFLSLVFSDNQGTYIGRKRGESSSRREVLELPIKWSVLVLRSRFQLRGSKVSPSLSGFGSEQELATEKGRGPGIAVSSIRPLPVPRISHRRSFASCGCQKRKSEPHQPTFLLSRN